MSYGQTRKGSFIESLVNVAVGYTIGLVSNIIILGAYGIKVTLGTQVILTTWFTAVSIARSYTLRRIFNWITGRTECDNSAPEQPEIPTKESLTQRGSLAL